MAYRNYIPEPQYYAPIRVERKTPGRNMFDYLGPIANAISTWQSGNLKSKMFEHQMAQQEQARADRLAQVARAEQQRKEDLLYRQSGRDIQLKQQEFLNQIKRDSIAEKMAEKARIGTQNQKIADWIRGAQTENPLRETWDMGLDYGDDMMDQPTANMRDDNLLAEAVESGFNPSTALKLQGQMDKAEDPVPFAYIEDPNFTAKMEELSAQRHEHATGFESKAFEWLNKQGLFDNLQDRIGLPTDTFRDEASWKELKGKIPTGMWGMFKGKADEYRGNQYNDFVSQLRGALYNIGRSYEGAHTNKDYLRVIADALKTGLGGAAAGQEEGFYGNVSSPELASLVQNIKQGQYQGTKLVPVEELRSRERQRKINEYRLKNS